MIRSPKCSGPVLSLARATVVVFATGATIGGYPHVDQSYSCPYSDDGIGHVFATAGLMLPGFHAWWNAPLISIDAAISRDFISLWWSSSAHISWSSAWIVDLPLSREAILLVSTWAIGGKRSTNSTGHNAFQDLPSIGTGQ
ncbi:hypothetical protein DERF_009865 [Dermatophagoides farinae]|uniref:Uncharacterized protein n=1 Tax=Dermatophagoides farinae TaxID=6954 RepID=A0A922HUS5_DERFA|nr:hypothetical protein DERF_009865 [Dermatophagoides farinae]